jgi:sarcosine oxidase subunit gamma
MADLVHRTPLADRLGAGSAAIRRPGLDIAEPPIAAQVMLTGDVGAADVVSAVARATGCRLIDQPNRKTGSDPYALWLAPDKRLLVAMSGTRFALLRDLAQALAGRFATASDVTDGLAMLDLGGARVPDLLAMACALDLDPRRFGADDSARTLCADVPVLLYRLRDRPGFRLHVERSILAHLWTWLEQAASAVAP